MPDNSTHLIAGFISVWIFAGVFWYFYRTIPQLTLPTLFVMAIAGILGGKGPDIPEPGGPEHGPEHQGLWHWIVGPIVVGILTYEMCFEDTRLFFVAQSDIGWLFLSFLAGYASHIILDFAQKIS